MGTILMSSTPILRTSHQRSSILLLYARTHLCRYNKQLLGRLLHSVAGSSTNSHNSSKTVTCSYSHNLYADPVGDGSSNIAGSDLDLETTQMSYADKLCFNDSQIDKRNKCCTSSYADKICLKYSQPDKSIDRNNSSKLSKTVITFSTDLSTSTDAQMPTINSSVKSTVRNFSYAVLARLKTRSSTALSKSCRGHRQYSLISSPWQATQHFYSTHSGKVTEDVDSWEMLVDYERLSPLEKQIHNRHRDAVKQRKLTYVDPMSGYHVMTRFAHTERGECCGNACRHCPFGQIKVIDEKNKKTFNSAFYV